MSETAPAAPAAEPVAPATPAPEAPAAPAAEPTPAPAAPTPAPAESTTNTYFTPEQLSEMQRMFESNGGFEKAWGKMKEGISRPKPAEQPAPEPTPQPAPQSQQAAPQQRTEGVYSMQELAVVNYFERLSKDPKYASVSKEIADGSVLKKMQELNLNPFSQEGVDDRMLRNYLDLYAASKPAQPTSATPTSSQADYVKVEKVTSMEDANKIQLQNFQLRAQGMPEHPLTKEAEEFVKSYYAQKK